ncbi:MAG TPA: ABC transporter permease [Thermomicrobiales bacterium]|nr:ABC transporter permease [Thermomicrobiales bacterium]
MGAYLIRRTISTIVLLYLIVTVVFLLLHLLPGDPAMTILGGIDANPTEEDIARVRERLGLDRPLYVQYLDWMGSLLRGDLGTSFVNNRSVADDLFTRLPRTMMLIMPAVILAVLLGMPMGIIAARFRKSLVDPGISSFALIGFSVPVFVSGLLLVYLFSLKLGWLPANGYVSPADDFIGFLKRAVMPIVTLSLGPMAITMRMTRSSMLEQMGLDYVRTARAKGLTEFATMYRHVLRNALLPVVTVVALQFGAMFAGSVLVELIFNWPGVNSYLLTSISVRDYPVVQAIVLVIATIFVLINFLTDVSFAMFDPRIRHD